jgi:membrane-bound lytic murein transglycosylase D
MHQIFRDRGLPIELTYLPIVESSTISTLDPMSVPWACGSLCATGRQFMRVDRSIDEETHRVHAGRGSVPSQSYEMLGNWPLAITAYNYGPGGMLRAVATIESDNLVDLIRDYRHPNWGFPPQNFYAEFLAAVEIGKNVNQYFPELSSTRPWRFRKSSEKSCPWLPWPRILA